MSEGWQDSEEPNVAARRQVLCREVRWRSFDPDAPYTLLGVVHRLRSRVGFPFVQRTPLYLYAENQGDAGEYDVWFELVRLVTDDDGEIVDEVDVGSFGPFVLGLTAGRFVHGRSYFVQMATFDEAGLYEFRLNIRGVDGPLASEQFIVEG